LRRLAFSLAWRVSFFAKVYPFKSNRITDNLQPSMRITAHLPFNKFSASAGRAVHNFSLM
jgi:hypothetical protein